MDVVEMSETKAAALYAHGWEKGAEPFTYQDNNKIPMPQDQASCRHIALQARTIIATLLP